MQFKLLTIEELWGRNNHHFATLIQRLVWTRIKMNDLWVVTFDEEQDICIVSKCLSQDCLLIKRVKMIMVQQWNLETIHFHQNDHHQGGENGHVTLGVTTLEEHSITSVASWLRLHSLKLINRNLRQNQHYWDNWKNWM